MNNKFEVIYRNSPWIKLSNFNNVVNMSSLPLTEDQMCVLGYGLSFALPLNEDAILDFLSDFSKFEYKLSLNNNNEYNVSTLKGFILNSIIRDCNSEFKFPKLLMDAVKYLRNNKDLIVCKADKGGKVVVTDKTIYNNKMQDIVNDTNTYTELRSNPLKSWQQSFNKQLKSLLKNHPDLEKNFRSFMPSLPMMYGLPKIHKENVPLRPIISTVNSVNYKLASWLAHHLTPFLNKISGCHLINTIEFTEKIKNLNIYNKKLVSFDVDSLYTNVPVSECLQLLEERL